MPDQTVEIIAIERLTPDVRRYVVLRPEGYSFEPGQATDLHLDRDGWRDETRPFTFTSLPDDDHLEFVIKSYPSHDGVTEQIGMLEVGDHFVIGEPWGAITDAGPGTFIAGGAGITPFVAILRARRRNKALEGCQLIFSNSTESDIILRRELAAMPGLRTDFIVTDQPSSPLAGDRLDRDALKSLVTAWDQQFYVCGPPPMVEDLTDALDELGIDSSQITVEDTA